MVGLTQALLGQEQVAKTQPPPRPEHAPELPPPSSGATPSRTVHARLALNGTGKGTIEVDGHDLAHHCKAIRLESGAGNFTVLTLALVLPKTTEFEGDTRVQLAPEVEQLLTSLGWTPPAACPCAGSSSEPAHPPPARAPTSKPTPNPATSSSTKTGSAAPP